MNTDSVAPTQAEGNAPLSLCQCGCGLPAPIAKWNKPEFGHVAGEPTRFRRGHNSRTRGVSIGGYPALYLPDHPGADEHGRVMEHVFIAEEALGHPLPEHSEVHHVDEDRRNNSRGNLVICQDRDYHVLLHVRAQTVRAGGDPNNQKLCRGCKRVLAFAAFYRETRRISTGLTARCRECVRASRRGGAQ